MLLPQWGTAFLDPQPPSAVDNKCIGRSQNGQRCRNTLSAFTILRVTDLVRSLENTDPRDITREHLTLGDNGYILDCFCGTHAPQATGVLWAWLAAIREEGRKKHGEEKTRKGARIERWLEGIDPAYGEGLTPV